MAPKKPVSAKDIHVSGDFIAGDQYNYYYTGDFASLAEYYISPEPVFQRVRTDDFIGRDWLTAKVDSFLNDSNRKSGAFLLIGDAGVGKTSFMAHLVKERRYLHLFAEQAPGQAMLQRAMQSLGSQLVTRYQIDPYKDRDTLNALSVFPDFLERILRLAASTLTEGEKIVIVCDALDEAGIFPDHFVFGLPKELPDGVYFILSQRPVNVKLPNLEPLIEKLEAQGEGNLRDMEAYLGAVAKRPEVAGQIRSKEYSEEFFIQTLKEKSQGVWMYLHYIIKEIESGARAPLDLANLPTGLVGYYAEYWDSWRTGKRGKGEEAWDELYAPLLTTLAAAQEAIPVDWLIQWADVTAKPREVTRLLTEHWRAFITEKEKDGQKTYTPYHLSFRDFITGRVDTTKLPPAQANLVKDIAAQTVDAHKRIVSTFEKDCNGEWEKLVEQDYPRLHLTAHLNGAGEYEKLRILLTEGDEKIKWAEAREKKEETYVGYLNDLTYVWDYVKQEQNYALAIRCVLIENSIHSIASNIPPELLSEILKEGIWSLTRGLEIIKNKSSSSDQVKSIKLIGSYIPRTLINEIISVAQNIENQEDKILALAYLAQYLDNKSKSDFIQNIKKAAGDVGDTNKRLAVLTTLLPNIPFNEKKIILSEILSSVYVIENKVERANILLSVFDHYEDEKVRKKILHDVYTITFNTINLTEKASLLSRLMYIMNNEKSELMLTELLGKIDKSNNVQDKIYALINILPHLHGKRRRRAIRKSLLITKKMPKGLQRATPLSLLATNLHSPNKNKVILNALADLSQIQCETEQTYFISTIVNNFNAEMRIRAIKYIHSVSHKIDGNTFVKIMSNLFPYIDDENRSVMISEIERYKSDYLLVQALSNIASFLNEDLRHKLFIVSKEIKDPSECISALSILIPILENNDKEIAVSELVASCKELGSSIRYKNSSLEFSSISPYLDIASKKTIQSIVYEIEESKERALFWIRLASLFEDELRAKCFENAFYTTYKIKDLEERVEVLEEIVSYPDYQIRHFAIQDLLSLLSNNEFDDDIRFGALASIAPYLSKDEDFDILTNIFSEALRSLRETGNTRLLLNVLPHMNEYSREQALGNIRRIRYSLVRADALLTMLPYLDKSLRENAVLEILDTTDEIKEVQFRVNIYIKLMPFLDQQRIVDIFSNYVYFKSNNSAIGLVGAWKDIDYIGLDTTLLDVLNFTTKKDRKDGLEFLSALTPALVHLRGPAIADELYRTITDVTRWWP